MNFSEQDTRVKIIDEKLKLALWNEENIIREYYFNAGKKLIGGKRGQRKFVDYLLKFQNKHLAIIEAKKLSKDPLWTFSSTRICKKFRCAFCVLHKWRKDL